MWALVFLLPSPLSDLAWGGLRTEGRGTRGPPCQAVRPVQLLAWAQAWAAICGPQHSCLVEGQPKPCRWGGGRWPVGRPIHSGMGWKNTWLHSVDPPQKVKECACWQLCHGLSYQAPMVLLWLKQTETHLSSSKLTAKPTRESFCSSCVEAGQQGHLACLEVVWGAVRQGQALWFKTGHFRGGESLHVVWLLPLQTPFILQCLWPSFSSSSHKL